MSGVIRTHLVKAPGFEQLARFLFLTQKSPEQSPKLGHRNDLDISVGMLTHGVPVSGWCGIEDADTAAWQGLRLVSLPIVLVP